jgi:hypothetical protein
MRQLQSITTQGLASSTLPDNQHQAIQNPAATQHSIRQSTPGQPKSGSNAAQHQAINTRQSNIRQQRSTASGNQQQAKQHPAATQHITRQSTPGQLRRGRNAPHHKTIDIRASKTGQQRSISPRN